ncbi:MAG: phosphate/phosphite/phosphonate ABC transporter substrate-binding protein [Chloroflexota bacterium]|nr:phosphate/phosphite/phosphonate ABC transporter substrate-binding protein [Chloroflexota bacterium]MDQ5867346.1 phosphate/phosphite/phosphonate ABC transporter substrate-binding protein [Chloroflexota bacterium]
MASPKRILTATALMALALPVVSAYQSAPATAQAAFADPAFQATWNRTDKLVADGTVKRSFYWGPTPGETKTEAYAQGQGGTRKVQYFDKSRMEINDPNADKNSPFYVTNGLLTVELISGKMQVGNTQYQTRYPANIPLASDIDDPNAPTYATFFLIANSPLGDHPADDRTGQTVVEQVNRAGIVSKNNNFEKYGVKYGFYNTETKHNIASQIWDFLNAQGPTLNAQGQTTNARLSDPWFYTSGYAISEPYWANVKIAGKQTDVLIQLFERRVVTYVPDAPEGFKVQMGNIGAHYYDWRYKNAGQQAYANPDVKPVTPAPGSLGSPENPIKLAFAPSSNSTAILASGEPLGRLLGQVTGYTYKVSVPTSYAAVIEAMGSNNVDVGFLAPFQYAIANQKYGAQVMLVTVRKGALTYPSVFITADPNIKSLADLKGKKFAFGDPASASNYLYPFAALKAAGYIKGTNAEEYFGAGNVLFAGGHDRVVTAVYNGQVAAGAVFGGPLDPATGAPTDARSLPGVVRQFPDVFQKVRIFAETQQIPNDTVAARKGLDDAMLKQIQGGLLEITNNVEGRKLLYALYTIDDLAPVTDSFFDPLRQVARDAGIENFEQLNAPRPTATPAPR